MSKHDSSPTMIIPSGTEIQIDVHGQLSVRTPGNLVIQNSGHYGEIESVHGSIRIEANAEVEAVSLRCAETCYVQGSLTSWKVKAKAIQLEEKAQARIVLQETESINIGKNAQLVGNFSSEKELFLLFSRFARQLRSLPFYFDRKDDARFAEAEPEAELPPVADAGSPSMAASPTVATTVSEAVSEGPVAEVPPDSGGRGETPGHVAISPLPSKVLEASEELPDQLFFALVLLEREAKNESYGTSSMRVLDELVKLLKGRDLEALQHTHITLFGRVVEPGDDVRRAQELIEQFFEETKAQHTADA